MANVINKNNPLEYLRSVDPSNYDPAEWIILDTTQKIADVEAINSRYRKVEGNLIKEMNATEKTAVDTQYLNLLKEYKKATADSESNRHITDAAQTGDVGEFLKISERVQRRHLARVNVIIEKKADSISLTQAEQDYLTDIKSKWNSIQDINSRADNIKDDISALSNENDVNSYDVIHSIRWTE